MGCFLGTSCATAVSMGTSVSYKFVVCGTTATISPSTLSIAPINIA